MRRKSFGLLSREKRVERIEVTLGDEMFSLTVSRPAAEATRSKSVRGIVIKREVLDLETWLKALDDALADEAQRSETARLALERMLS